MVQIVKLIGQGLNNTVVTGGLVPKGAYNAGTDYAVGDSVDYNGSSYVMHTDAAAGTVPTNTTYWQVLANKGDTGATGADGPNNVTTSTTTNITGILKGDGANVSAAVADTDYQDVLAEGAFVDGDKTKLDDLDAQLYNVVSYGATGDGATEDTTAVTNAISAANSAGGGVVFFPEGTYIVSPFNVSANVILRGVGLSSIIKLKPSYNSDNNVVKLESVTNAGVEYLTIDGNKSGQASGTNYGLYVASSSECHVTNVLTKNCTGVGNHSYDNDRVSFDFCWSTANDYHGFESEQNRDCSFTNCYGYSNTLHGLLVAPGEVSGSGSKGNSFTNFHCSSNSQYGIASNAANGDISAFLSEGDMFTNCSARSNTQYGVSFYKQDGAIINGLYVEDNGFFGIYLYQSANNVWNNVFIKNNSQSGAGSYDEMRIEGASAGHASDNNLFTNLQITTDGATKANYQILESATGDANKYVNVNLEGSPVTGATSLSTSSLYDRVDLVNAQTVGGLKTFTNGVAVAANATLGGSDMGLDAPFGTAALRLVNNNTSGNFQLVTPNGNTNIWAGGNNVADFTSSGLQINSGYNAIPTTDSASTLGTSSLYWSNTYTDRLYVNSTAYIDGATAGKAELNGQLGVVGSNGTLTISSATDGGEFNIGSSATGTLAIYGSAGNTLHVNLLDGNLTVGAGSLIKATSSPPASAAAAGTTGQIEWDSSYIYICIATNTWQRVAHATW